MVLSTYKHRSTLNGLPHEALETISQRLSYVQPLLAQLDHIEPSLLSLLNINERSQHGAWLHALERSIGRDKWIRQYLLPIAEQFGLRHSVEESFVRECWKMHLFDVGIGRRRRQPDLEDVLPKVLHVFATSPYKTYWEDKLQELCRDQWSVESVITQYQQLNGRLSGLVRGIILAYLESGEIGLLRFSSHPYAEELLLLQEQVPYIARLYSEPDHLIAILRADIIAWYKTLHNIDSSLWQRHLLTDSPGTVERQHYQQRLKPYVRKRVIEGLKEYRQCDEHEASKLLNTLLDTGLLGLIDWRYTELVQQPATPYSHQRVFSILSQKLEGLHPEAQREIEEIIRHLLS